MGLSEVYLINAGYPHLVLVPESLMEPIEKFTDALALPHYRGAKAGA